MRQIFSIRFFAALAGVAVLGLLVAAGFGGDDSVADIADDAALERRIELVATVFSAERDEAFDIGADGRTRGHMELVLDLERRVRIVEGTYGEITCEELDQLGRCVVVADLLGDGVVWFAVVPLGRSDTVEMPAIVELVDGIATLENGWQVPYADVLERQCPDDYSSFREMVDEVGTDFTSIYDLAEGELTDVVCTPD